MLDRTEHPSDRSPAQRGSPPSNHLAESQSPSLRPIRCGEPRAFELKFKVTEETARAVEAALGGDFHIDPHGDPGLAGDYRLASLYCDTPAFDVFRRIGHHRYRKYRIRRYGDSGEVYLERKTRGGMQVRKRRLVIPLADLPRLGQPTTESWTGSGYAAELLRRSLGPVCRIAYRRRAYYGLLDGRPSRVTFDRELRCEATNDWRHAEQAMVPFLEGWVVAELKWRGALPARFKALIESIGVAPGGVSKYRHGVQALGLASLNGTDPNPSTVNGSLHRA